MLLAGEPFRTRGWLVADAKMMLGDGGVQR
jgi:hypothetical protein